jgi:hypothetical protein
VPSRRENRYANAIRAEVRCSSFPLLFSHSSFHLFLVYHYPYPSSHRPIHQSEQTSLPNPPLLHLLQADKALMQCIHQVETHRKQLRYHAKRKCSLIIISSCSNHRASSTVKYSTRPTLPERSSAHQDRVLVQPSQELLEDNRNISRAGSGRIPVVGSQPPLFLLQSPDAEQEGTLSSTCDRRT